MRLPIEKRIRGSYVGGPMAAAVCGYNDFASSFDCYAQLVHGHRPVQTKKMKRGLRAEAGLAEHAAAYRGKTLDRDCFFLDDVEPRMGCSVDACERPYSQPRVLHSFKSTRSDGQEAGMAERWGPTDSDLVDRYAYAQCQWEMEMVPSAELSHVWLEDLSVDEDPRHFEIKRNRDFGRDMRQKVAWFLANHVDKRRPPTTKPFDPLAAKDVWPESEPGKEIPATPEMIQAARIYAMHRLIRDEAQATMDVASAVLSGSMGTAEVARWGDPKAKPATHGSIFFKGHRLPDPKTNFEEVAYQLARMFKVPGEVFHGLLAEHTSRPWIPRHIKVTVADLVKPKKGV